MLNEWRQFWFSPHNQHTDIRVHRGSIHGLNELAKAFLVTIHLPVSTDKEFPAHVCVFEGVSLGIKTMQTGHKVHKGERAGITVQSEVFIKWEIWQLLPHSFIG